MKNISAVTLARAGIIAALYASLTVLLAPISYGPLQFRIAECLSVTAFFYPEAIVGLTIGCFIANIFGNGIFDMVFGTAATLISSLLTYFIGKMIKKQTLKFAVGASFPVLINAFVVPFSFLAVTELKSLYFISALEVGVGQAVVIYTLGACLFFALTKKEKSDLKKGL